MIKMQMARLTKNYEEFAMDSTSHEFEKKIGRERSRKRPRKSAAKLLGGR